MSLRKLLICLLVPLTLGLAGCDDDNDGDDAAPPAAEDPTVFKFRSDPIGAYLKVDRMGGPATTTALLMPGAAGGARRQQANLTEPKDDGQYAAEYISTLRTLHFELGPALQALGLAACGVPGATAAETNVAKCVGQAVHLSPPDVTVIPDVLRLDTSRASGFPNGRDLDDQVIDLLLAVALLNLTDGGPTGCFGAACTARTLADLPLNPGASVPPPLAAFPFFNNVALAPPPAASP